MRGPNTTAIVYYPLAYRNRLGHCQASGTLPSAAAVLDAWCARLSGQRKPGMRGQPLTDNGQEHERVARAQRVRRFAVGLAREDSRRRSLAWAWSSGSDAVAQPQDSAAAPAAHSMLRSSSLIEVLARVCASTRLTMTAQYRL